MNGPQELRFFGSGANWMKMSSILALRLGGYKGLLPAGSMVSVTTTEPGLSCFDGPERVARGEFDIGISTPVWIGALANSGLPPYDRPHPVSSLACFPHDDRMLFGVRRETGIETFADIKAQKYPLRISTPPRATRHPAVWAAECVMREYGFDFGDIEAWGGEVLLDRPRDISRPQGGPMIDPSFTAIFDEAIMTHRWRSVTDEYDIKFLDIDEGVFKALEAKGWRRGVLPANRFRGTAHDVPTIDFSGWYLFCRPDLDDETAYLTIQAIDEQKRVIDQSYDSYEGLTGPVDMRALCSGLPVPLHPGAALYYREHGYLSAEIPVAEVVRA